MANSSEREKTTKKGGPRGGGKHSLDTDTTNGDVGGVATEGPSVARRRRCWSREKDLRSSVERADVDTKVSYVNYALIVAWRVDGGNGGFWRGSLASGTMTGALTWLRTLGTGVPGINTFNLPRGKCIRESFMGSACSESYEKMSRNQNSHVYCSIVCIHLVLLRSTIAKNVFNCPLSVAHM